MNATNSTSMTNLNDADFWAMIDRNIRNDSLAFADICKARDEESLMITLRHWQAKEGRVAARYAAIVKAEIMDRLDPSRLI